MNLFYTSTIPCSDITLGKAYYIRDSDHDITGEWYLIRDDDEDDLWLNSQQVFTTQCKTLEEVQVTCPKFNLSYIQDRCKSITKHLNKGR